MSRPRRPGPGRRPGQRPRGARTSGVRRARSTSRVPAGLRAHVGRPAGVTRRAVILGLVVLTLVVSAALPLREYLSQRSRIGAMVAAQEQTRLRVAALEQEKRQLDDPAFVAAEARRRLRLARPGETTYILVTPPPPVPSEEEPTADPDAPWFGQLWDSVQDADRPPAPPDATVVPGLPSVPVAPPVPQPADPPAAAPPP